MAEQVLPQIRPNDRICIFGMTGTGKSILAHYIFWQVPVRLPDDEHPTVGFWRICIDITDSIVDESVTFYTPDEIPWDLSDSLRFVPNIDTIETDVDILYQEIMLHGSCWVWLDEANEISSAHKTVPGFRKVLLQGRKFLIGNCSVTPRPVDINKSIITQSEHQFIFGLVDEGDRRRVAGNVGMTLEDFDVVMSQLPDFGYLWYSVRDRTIFPMPPLPLDVVDSLEGVGRQPRVHLAQ
ncbi:MAG: hypothetical protein ACRDFB_06360 [Rhabdochlamydiaceae bacterium]